MFYVTNQVMRFAPFGVFALIGVTVSKFGVSSLLPLGKLILVVYGAMIFFILVVFGLIAKWAGIRIFSLFKILKDELILAYSTASSEAVLPRIMDKMEKIRLSEVRDLFRRTYRLFVQPRRFHTVSSDSGDFLSPKCTESISL